MASSEKDRKSEHNQQKAACRFTPLAIGGLMLYWGIKRFSKGRAVSGIIAGVIGAMIPPPKKTESPNTISRKPPAVLPFIFMQILLSFSLGPGAYTTPV
jgi:hypothetical protein